MNTRAAITPTTTFRAIIVGRTAWEPRFFRASCWKSWTPERNSLHSGEHCLNYIWDNAAAYRISTFDPQEPWLCRPELKLDLDRAEDFQRLALLPLTPEMDARAIVTVMDAAA